MAQPWPPAGRESRVVRTGGNCMNLLV